LGLYLIASILDFGFWILVLEVAVGLGMVIFVHELGHFVVAKLCGVKCEKFYLGFDIAGWKICKFRWGETEYGIGVLPLGGYVKMLGQEDNPARLKEEIERAKAAKAAGGTDPTSPAESGGEGKSAEPPIDIEAAEAALYDPRSYLAQSVPKRMAIISAGVIMNLVFAFAAATVAYAIGVNQIACEVGALQPGDPAWAADLRVGDKILDINGKPVHQYRDLQARVSLSGKGIFSFLSSQAQKNKEAGVTMQVRRPGVDGTLSVTMHPNREGLIPTIGVVNPWTTTLLTDPSRAACAPGSPAALAKPSFKAGDKIVAVDGAAVEDWRQLHRQFALHRDKPLAVTVERIESPDTTKTLTIDVAARPMRRAGLVMAMGSVAAVQDHSPAAEAGVKPGDRITAIDGELPGDPLTLPDRLRGRAGRSVVLTVDREGKELKIPVLLRATETYEEPLREDSPVSVPAMGIAYYVDNKIDAVIPDSPAATAGIRAGDVLVKATLLPPDKDSVERTDGKNEGFEDASLKFTAEKRNWPAFLQVAQSAPPGSRAKLGLEGKGEVTLDMVDSPDWFNPDRGFRFERMTFPLKAGSLGEAIDLGGEETWESATQVLVFLDRLLSGQISPKALGGPVMIAKAAGQSASQGMPQFLLFLTLLSANLAVINFLPIPVLDGGHMAFLTWEAIRGKPADERVQLALSYLGLLFILGLMLWVISLDVHLIPRE
jgi:regulator of sigma E protease